MIKGLSEMLMGFAPLVLKPRSSFGPCRWPNPQGSSWAKRWCLFHQPMVRP